MDAANLFLIAGDVTSAKDVAARLEELPAGARRFYLQAKIAWLGGEPGAAEELATLAWSRAEELDRTGRGTLAAILAQLHNVRGDGRPPRTGPPVPWPRSSPLTWSTRLRRPGRWDSR